MGYNRLPFWKYYWSTSNDLSRFDDILCFLHINNNNAKTTDNKDRLFKLRLLLDSINIRFMELYKVTREVSVDELMVLFKGRNSIKQYNLMKLIKRGKEKVIHNFVDFGLGERVVLNLTKPYCNKGMKLENTFAYGTIQSNRKGIPLLSQDKTLERGMYDFKTSRLDITVYKWKDNRIVHLASNFHNA
ncbi:Uncharacterized protein FWK35_00018911 [Aphis craccivora]|uniref:PiggyBac transposable element-derived protein domain-containing protein n=1 Tax=Aphis craccivora TaxID=307492 RepID=A0A6G0Y2H9_APHCR|nr:Uncharacterized protein FWK35_00018911 [Aphis craccivora]